MTKSELLQLVSQHYDAWLASEKNQSNAYEFEKSFDHMWTNLGKLMLQNSLGKLPNDRRKKKAENQIWNDRST